MATRIRLKRKLSTGNDGIKLMPGEPYYNLEDGQFFIGAKDKDFPEHHLVQLTRGPDDDVDNDLIDLRIGNESNSYTKRVNNVQNASHAENADFAANLKLNSSFVGTDHPDSVATLADAPEGSIYIMIEED